MRMAAGAPSVLTNSELVAFPRKVPRWVSSPKKTFALRALSMYRPSKMRPRLATAALRSALHLGVGSRLIKLVGTPPAADVIRAIEAVLVVAAKTELEIDQVLAWTGAPGPTQKLTVLAVDPKNVPVAYAKVGHSPLVLDLLEHELRILEDLAGTRMRDCAPRVIAAERVADQFVLLLTPVAGTRHPGGVLTTRESVFVRNIESSLATPDRAEYVSRIVSGFADVRHEETRDLFASAFATAEPILDFEGSVVWSHGDFTPWNLLRDGDSLAAIDWEFARPRAALWDLFHYAAQIEVFTKRSSVPATAARLVSSRWLAPIRNHLALRPLSNSLDRDLTRLQVLYLVESALDQNRYQQDPRGLHIRINALNRVMAQEGSSS